MCARTIDCRCDTCIDGITRYQWPRIIAVHAPPSSSDDVTKLAIVSAATAGGAGLENSVACITIATTPAVAAAARMAVRNLVNSRPVVAQAKIVSSVHAISAATDG